MSMNLKELAKEAKELSPFERVQLIDEIYESFELQHDNIDKKWSQEADSRVEAFQKGEIKTYSEEQIRNEINELMKK